MVDWASKKYPVNQSVIVNVFLELKNSNVIALNVLKISNVIALNV